MDQEYRKLFVDCRPPICQRLDKVLGLSLVKVAVRSGAARSQGSDMIVLSY